MDDAAFGRLVEYPFEGEDAELASIVQRLVASLEDDVVRAADVDRLNLSVEEEAAPKDQSDDERHRDQKKPPAMRLSKRF
jgi:hypothetical protein